MAYIQHVLNTSQLGHCFVILNNLFYSLKITYDLIVENLWDIFRHVFNSVVVSDSLLFGDLFSKLVLLVFNDLFRIRHIFNSRFAFDDRVLLHHRLTNHRLWHKLWSHSLWWNKLLHHRLTVHHLWYNW